jgi:hypothetical protein
MALTIDFSGQQISSKIMQVIDLTGVYDPTNNPGGFGVDGVSNIAPNIVDIQDIGEDRGILITFEKNGILSECQLTTTEILARGWPNFYKTPLVLLASDFRLDEFPDGKCTVTVKISGVHNYSDNGGTTQIGFASEKSHILFLTAKAECCHIKMANKVPEMTPGTFCKSKEAKAFQYATLLMDIINNYKSNRQWDKAESVLTKLQAHCISEKSDCDGC